MKQTTVLTNNLHIKACHKHFDLLADAFYIILQLYPHLLDKSDKQEQFDFGEKVIDRYLTDPNSYEAYKLNLLHDRLASGFDSVVNYEKYKKLLDYIFSQTHRLMQMFQKESSKLALIIRKEQVDHVTVVNKEPLELQFNLETNMSRHYYYIMRTFKDISEYDDVLFASGLKTLDEIEDSHRFLKKEVVASMRKVLIAYYNFNKKYKIIVKDKKPLPPRKAKKRT